MLKSESQLPPFIVEWQRSDKDGVVVPVIVPTQTTCVCGVLKIRIISARELYRVPRSKKEQSPYAELRIGDVVKKGPKDDEGGSSAEWDSEDIEFHLDGRHDELQLEIIHDHRRTNGRETIGRSLIPLKSLLQLANPTAYVGVDDSLANDPFFFHEAWFNISRDHGKVPAGRVLLRSSFVADFQRARNVSTHIPERSHSTGKLFGSTLAQALAVSDFHVPILMHRCCEYLLSKATDVVGVFRITADQNDLDNTKSQLETNPFTEFTDVHVCAAVLKAYLREMAEPVIPFSHYEFFIEWAKKRPNPKEEPTQEELETYQALVASLPPIHRECLKFLCNFLAEMASHSEETKMDVKNLSIVLAPNVLRVPHRARLEKKNSWFPGSSSRALQIEEDNNALNNAKHILTCMEVLTNHQKYLFATGINDRQPSRDSSRPSSRTSSKDKGVDYKTPFNRQASGSSAANRSSSTSRAPTTRSTKISPEALRSRSPPPQQTKISSFSSVSENSRKDALERGSLVDKEFVCLSLSSSDANFKTDGILKETNNFDKETPHTATPPPTVSASSSLPSSFNSFPPRTASQESERTSLSTSAETFSSFPSSTTTVTTATTTTSTSTTTSPSRTSGSGSLVIPADFLGDTVDRLTQENIELYDRLASLTAPAEGEAMEELRQMHQKALRELARLESDVRAKEAELRALRHTKAPPPPSPKHPSLTLTSSPSHLTLISPSETTNPSTRVEAGGDTPPATTSPTPTTSTTTVAGVASPGRRRSSPTPPNTPTTPTHSSRRKSGTKTAAIALFSSFPGTSRPRKKSSVTAKDKEPVSVVSDSNPVTISVAPDDLPASVLAAQQTKNSPRQPSPAPPRSRSPAPQRNPPPPPAPLSKSGSRISSRQST